MKKLSTILIIAFALVLGLSQCKKKVDTIATPSDLGEAVHITVNVDDGGKHIVYPGTGAYVFENGDKLYVGNGGHYIGYLTYGSGAFSGDIYSPSTEDYLHFYFVGGLTPSATPEAGTTQDFTVSIADQSTRLPVLSYGRSTAMYTDGNATYDCTLLNKCGLVKFVPATPTPETVRVHGMKTTATINFATPGITPTNATGTITLYPESNEAKWAILLPQDEVSTPEGMIGKYGCTMSKVPEVTENMYYTSVNMDAYKLGMLGGLFTINPDGGKVHFSQGNLQAVGTTSSSSTSGWTWRFADNQYDYKGNAVANTSISSNGTVSADGTVDLFGWSTAATYYGINKSATDGDYSGGFVDWGGTIGNSWSTLSKGDWAWVLGPKSGANPGTNCRTSSTVNNIQNARFAKATVNSKAGVIIFPDNYTHPSGVTQPTNINGYTSNYTGNSYDATQWSSMESAGAVFLPAAGCRYGSSVSYAGYDGYYWSSTSNYSSLAYNVNFYASSLNPGLNHSRYYGYSVRLVYQVED